MYLRAEGSRGFARARARGSRPRRRRRGGAAATRPRNIRAAKVRDMSNGPDSNVAEILKKRHSAHNETTS